MTAAHHPNCKCPRCQSEPLLLALSYSAKVYTNHIESVEFDGRGWIIHYVGKSQSGLYREYRGSMPLVVWNRQVEKHREKQNDPI